MSLPERPTARRHPVEENRCRSGQWGSSFQGPSAALLGLSSAWGGVLRHCVFSPPHPFPIPARGPITFCLSWQQLPWPVPGLGARGHSALRVSLTPKRVSWERPCSLGGSLPPTQQPAHHGEEEASEITLPRSMAVYVCLSPLLDLGVLLTCATCHCTSKTCAPLTHLFVPPLLCLISAPLPQHLFLSSHVCSSLPHLCLPTPVLPHLHPISSDHHCLIIGFSFPFLPSLSSPPTRDWLDSEDTVSETIGPAGEELTVKSWVGTQTSDRSTRSFWRVQISRRGGAR